MIGSISAASPAESRLLGGGRLEGPMPFVLAIMMFVMLPNHRCRILPTW